MQIHNIYSQCNVGRNIILLEKKKKKLKSIMDFFCNFLYCHNLQGKFGIII